MRAISERTGRRRKIVLGGELGPVAARDLFGDGELGVAVQAMEPGLELASWLRAQSGWVAEQLATRGAVLCSGFGGVEVEPLVPIAETLGGTTFHYRERSTPRTHVGPGVYTSTEHPAHERIELHNENSYARWWPRRLIFECLKPADAGGETLLADCREVYRLITPSVRAAFETRGVRYIRNLGGAVGLSWQEVFQTDDRAEVDRLGRAWGYELSWDGDQLRTQRDAPTILRDRQGRGVWFNHAAFFHRSGLPARVRDELVQQLGPDGLPADVRFADGTVIPDELIAEVRAAYRAAERQLRWRRGDVLVVDNQLVAHGRAPFRGSREILVVMRDAAGHEAPGPVGSSPPGEPLQPPG